MRKLLLILVLCGILHGSQSTRMRFESFPEPCCRQDPHFNGDAVYKREHFFPRDAIVQSEPMLPQSPMMRNEPIYTNERLLPHPPPPQSPPQQVSFPNEHFIPNEQLMQAEPMMQGDAFIKADPILRREPFIRREPLFRREPFIRRGRIFQNGPGVFRSEPGSYAVMMAQCQCQAPRMEQNAPQEAFFPIPQPMPQQPIMSQFIIPKESMKSQVYQPIIAFPRFQRFMRKSFKPAPDNFQFAPAPVQPQPEFNSFSSESVPFSGNFQNQASQQENTSEPSQNKPVTVRTVQQMPNALTLAQMSSIC